MRTGTTLCLLALCAAAACGGRLEAGKTPKETVRKFEAAVRDADLGGCYDLLSSRTRKRLDSAMLGVKAMLAAVPDSQLGKFGLDGIADMEPREILVACAEVARDRAPGLTDQLKSFRLVVLDEERMGDRAELEITQLMNGSEQTSTVPLVKEGGRWYLDSDEAINGLPVNPGQGVQASFTPS